MTTILEALDLDVVECETIANGSRASQMTVPVRHARLLVDLAKAVKQLRFFEEKARSWVNTREREFHQANCWKATERVDQLIDQLNAEATK